MLSTYKNISIIISRVRPSRHPLELLRWQPEPLAAECPPASLWLAPQVPRAKFHATHLFLPRGHQTPPPQSLSTAGTQLATHISRVSVSRVSVSLTRLAAPPPHPSPPLHKT